MARAATTRRGGRVRRPSSRPWSRRGPRVEGGRRSIRGCGACGREEQSRRGDRSTSSGSTGDGMGKPSLTGAAAGASPHGAQRTPRRRDGRLSTDSSTRRRRGRARERAHRKPVAARHDRPLTARNTEAAGREGGRQRPSQQPPPRPSASRRGRSRDAPLPGLVDRF